MHCDRNIGIDEIIACSVEMECDELPRNLIDIFLSVQGAWRIVGL